MCAWQEVDWDLTLVGFPARHVGDCQRADQVLASLLATVQTLDNGIQLCCSPLPPVKQRDGALPSVGGHKRLAAGRQRQAVLELLAVHAMPGWCPFACWACTFQC